MRRQSTSQTANVQSTSSVLHRSRAMKTRDRVCKQRLEIGRSLIERLQEQHVTRSSTYTHQIFKRIVVNEFARAFQCFGKAVHGADVGDQQVLRTCGFSSYFAVEVQSARSDPSLLQDDLPEEENTV